MKNLYIIWIFFPILCITCQGQRTAEQNHISKIGKDMFQHHYITQDLPGETDWGYGCPALAGF